MPLLTTVPPPSEAPASRPRRWAVRTLAVVAGVALSAVLISATFFRVHLAGGLSLEPRFDVGLWLRELPANLPWVLAFMALTALVIPLRALQWRHTLGERSPGFGQRYHAVAIGAFFHNAVPGKLGEFVRALLLARRAKISFFESLGSVLIGKLLELVALICVVAVALCGPVGPGASGRLGMALAIATGLCLAFFTLALLGARHALPLGLKLQRRGKFPRVSLALMNLGKGLSATRSPRRAAIALALSTGPVLASAMAYGVALHFLGVPRGLFAGGVVLGAVSLGQLTPGLPIGMGMYYLTSSWAARSLGASGAEAASFAALTHLATASTQLLVGFVSLLSQRIRPRELLAQRERLAEAMQPQAEPAVAISISEG